MEVSGIESGMDVYDVAGDKIGTVKDIVAGNAYSERDQARTDTAADETAAAVADAGTDGGADESETYLRVEYGGLLGIAARDLYVPASAIQNVVPGDNVMLDCPADDAKERYSAKPDGVDAET